MLLSFSIGTFLTNYEVICRKLWYILTYSTVRKQTKMIAELVNGDYSWIWSKPFLLFALQASDHQQALHFFLKHSAHQVLPHQPCKALHRSPISRGTFLTRTTTTRASATRRPFTAPTLAPVPLHQWMWLSNRLTVLAQCCTILRLCSKSLKWPTIGFTRSTSRSGLILWCWGKEVGRIWITDMSWAFVCYSKCLLFRP